MRRTAASPANPGTARRWRASPSDGPRIRSSPAGFLVRVACYAIVRSAVERIPEPDASVPSIPVAAEESCSLPRRYHELPPAASSGRAHPVAVTGATRCADATQHHRSSAIGHEDLRVPLPRPKGRGPHCSTEIGIGDGISLKRAFRRDSPDEVCLMLHSRGVFPLLLRTTSIFPMKVAGAPLPPSTPARVA
jgi:hypothetical protein